MIGGNAPGAIEALGHQHPYQRMGQGQRRQRPALFGGGLALRRQALRASHQQGHIAAIQFPGFQLHGELFRGPGLAGDIQGHKARAAGRGQHGFPFFLQDAGNVGIFTALSGANFDEFEWHVFGKTATVLFEATLYPGRHLGAHCNQLDLHRLLHLCPIAHSLERHRSRVFPVGKNRDTHPASRALLRTPGPPVPIHP